jgi:hypothetical protein
MIIEENDYNICIIIMNKCPYSATLTILENNFGKPGQGIHSYRIFNIAIVDVLFTIVGAYLISYFFKFSFIFTTIFLFGLGIFLNHIICVQTTVDKLLFT